MNYIVFDLEATCWRDRSQSPNEIIEIGAVKVNAQAEVIDEFSEFIRPIKHPVLSDFCTELTTIRQSDVETAPFFPEVVARFQEWVGVGQSPYLLCSWGFYDRKQLRSDCELHDLDKGWLRHHISVKHQHGKLYNLKRPLGMGQALKMEGLELEGTHHRGIDDAWNISKIFIKHFDKWKAK